MFRSWSGLLGLRWQHSWWQCQRSGVLTESWSVTGVQTFGTAAPQVCEDEERKEVLHSQHATLSHFRDKVREEGGLGDAKLLFHRETDLVGCLLQQERTLKIIGNFIVEEVTQP